MKKKVTIFGFICLALILVAMPFMAACGEEAPAPTTPTVPTTPTAPTTPTVPTTPPVAPPAGPAATPVTPPVLPPITVAGEPVYTVLDPRSWQEPWEIQGLSPRLDTLEGKRIIVVNLHGGNEIAIESLGPALQEAVPGCYVESLSVEGFWALSRDEKSYILDNFDGAIFGHDY